jgi:hypothetical protein
MMSFASLYNLVAPVGILAAIVLAIWVHRQTQKLRDSAAQQPARRKSSRRVRGFRGP